MFSRRLNCSAFIACFVAGLWSVTAFPANAETPEQGQVSAPQAAALERALSDYVENEKVANLSFGVWQNGALVTSGFYGPVRQDSDQSVSETSIHRIYSMTKPVTAIGLLILMEQGHFTLDDPITKFLPEFEETEVLADYNADGEMFTYRSIRPPTMAHLLSHTAGFVYGTDRFGFLEQKLTELAPLSAATSTELVEKVASLPYNAYPGSEWTYSISSDLQGAIIERITGESLDAFLKRELFEPLGMVDTGFFVPDEAAHRVSDVTKWSENGLIQVDDGPAHEAYQSSVFFEGGQGLFSTQTDYQKFAQFLLNEGRLGNVRLLGEEPLRQFRANAIKYRGEPGRQNYNGSTAGLGYGFGVATLEDRVIAELNAPEGSYFWYGALGTWFWVDPENHIVFVGMTQTSSVTGYELIQVSMNALYDPPAATNGKTTAK